MASHKIEFKYVGTPEVYSRSISAPSRAAAIKKLKSMGWYRPIRVLGKKSAAKQKKILAKRIRKLRK